MRSISVVLLALAAALAAPGAMALSGIPAAAEAPELSLPVPMENEIQAARELAEEAAGIEAPAAPLEPITPNLDEDGYSLPPLALAGLAVAGLIGVGFAAFHGGARFVTPAEVLANDVRQGIYSYLKVRVGANLKQVTDDLHLTTTNAIWHLRKLEEVGLIHSRRFNGYKVFYPAEGGIEARRMSLGKTALANENAQEVFENVVHNPGTHQREIARALGVNHGTVRWHLKKLMSAELIVETRKGKASSYAPTSTGLAALRQLQKASEPDAPAAPVYTAA